MSEPQRREPRFSGHESFVCRYGWLPKLHSAIALNPLLLKDEAQATITLGIGRNMVKSVQFWAEAFGVVESSEKGGYSLVRWDGCFLPKTDGTPTSSNQNRFGYCTGGFQRTPILLSGCSYLAVQSFLDLIVRRLLRAYAILLAALGRSNWRIRP
ncbi:DUF4007 family protein [Pseudomonas aeruginosa]